MNALTSKQRKLLYFVCIVVLTIPIIYLGAPASSGDDASGGKLAQIRRDEELGESTLGQVDPSSSTMNLVLLGLRGIASSVQWERAIEQQENKDWAGMRATVESIIMLQPHYLAVWEFQGWNLAYNVSAEWDDVKDRYYWVKEGLKFYIRGTERNRKMPALLWRVGDIYGKKIGRSDEWAQFRQFFMVDPDTKRYNGDADPELNPDRIDNYLVAKEWFERANDIEDDPGIEQHVMERILFRSYPSRAQFDYAAALHRENKINETSREAWDTAYDEWTKKFGREDFEGPAGTFKLEATDEEVKTWSEQDKVSIDFKRKWINEYQNRCQYRYWRTLAAAESEEDARDAHRHINEGKRLYREAKYIQSAEDKAAGKGMETWGALEYLEDGMAKYETVLNNFSELTEQDDNIEEAMVAILYWRNIFALRNEPIPDDYPLKGIWLKHQDRLAEMETEFRRDIAR